jgi:hypothetical protein
VPRLKDAAPDPAVILTVHEMKRLARNAAELMTLASALQAAGIQLELLSVPLAGQTAVNTAAAGGVSRASGRADTA